MNESIAYVFKDRNNMKTYKAIQKNMLLYTMLFNKKCRRGGSKKEYDM